MASKGSIWMTHLGLILLLLHRMSPNLSGNLKHFTYNGECTKTRFDAMKEQLKKMTIVFIVGRPGSGKTTLAWTVCKKMHGEMFEGNKWHMKTSISKQNIPDEDAITLLLLDSRFESAWTTEGTVKEVLNEVKELQSKLPCNQMRIIATVSQEAYHRIKKFECVMKLKSMGVIDLDAKGNAVTMPEMVRLLDVYDIHIKNETEPDNIKGISQNQLQSACNFYQHHSWFSMEKFIHKAPTLGFPLIAFLMSLRSNFIGDHEFIKEPIQHYLQSIEELRQSKEKDDRNKYCTLVYAAFNGGCVDLDNMDTGLMKCIGNQHYNNQSLESNPDFYVLQKRTPTASVYEFVHESLLQTFFAFYGYRYAKFTVKHCPLKVLLEHSISRREKIAPGEKSFYFRIGTPELEKMLVARILSEHIDIRYHRIWEQKEFQDIYATRVKENQYM